MPVVLLILLLTWVATPLAAQAPAPPADAQPPPAAAGVDPDRRFNPSQPDYTLMALPTTLRVPSGGGAFRVTHRFTRPLTRDSFGTLLENAFGLDSGARIGLEYRHGIRRGLQAGVHRTSDRTVQVFALQSLRDQRTDGGLGVAALASVDGGNNFREAYRPALGLVVSRELGDRGAVYVTPLWVGPAGRASAGTGHAWLVGLGARARVLRSVYVLVEAAPRLAGDTTEPHQVAFGIERRTGGHAFQLTAANGFGTTLGQLARGGMPGGDWHLGFSISRKFL